MSRVLVTGGAGFIGSHIVDALVCAGHEVLVYDNLSTGYRENLEHIWAGIDFIDGDIRDPKALGKAMEGVEYVFHQAALGSVVRSLEDPVLTNEININGTVKVLTAARDKHVKRVICASSSSVYGDSSKSPLAEEDQLEAKSPYALSKICAEEYVRVFWELFGLEGVSLRYFNVFGPRQDPEGPYASVIPVFSQTVLNGDVPRINGTGDVSRDFTYVSNAVQANLLAMKAPSSVAGKAFNIGTGKRTTLLELVETIGEACGKKVKPSFGPPREADIEHSLACIDRARSLLGYRPEISFMEGIRQTVEYYGEALGAGL